MREKLRIILAIACIAFVLLSFLIAGFYPVYICRDNTISINGIPYRQDPIVDWQPIGEKYKIGNLCGGVPFFTFLYKYQGDTNQLFASVASFPSDAEALPFHRTDISLPSFSAEVIDSVSMGINPDMTPGNMDAKEVIITDKTIIGEMASCFSSPVVKDQTKKIAGTSISLTAQSGLYENMIYKISVVAYDGKYCFIKADQTLYEIPQQLLEKIFNLMIYSPEQYSVTQ